jgi:hypothetical protein
VGWTNQVVIASEVIIAGEPDALLVYAGTPGPGTLVASITSTALVDQYGNVTEPVIAAYGSGKSAGLFGGDFFLNNLSIDESMIIGAFADGVEVNSIGAVPYKWIFNVPVIAEAGNISTPTVLATDTWHDLRPLATGFSGTVSGYYPPQYRLTVEQEVEIVGVVGLPGTGFNSVTFATLGLGYAPGKEWYLGGIAQLSNAGSPPGNSQSLYLSVDTGGNLQFHGIPAGAGAGPVFMRVSFPLDSSGLIES